MDVQHLDSAVRQYVRTVGTASWRQSQTSIDALQKQPVELLAACVSWLDAVAVQDAEGNDCAFLVLQVRALAAFRANHDAL